MKEEHSFTVEICFCKQFPDLETRLSSYICAIVSQKFIIIAIAENTDDPSELQFIDAIIGCTSPVL